MYKRQTVYGQPDELPVTEKAPIKKAESPYGNTKQINEEIIRDTVITEYLFLLLILKRILRVIRQLAQCGNTQALAE